MFCGTIFPDLFYVNSSVTMLSWNMNDASRNPRAKRRKGRERTGGGLPTVNGRCKNGLTNWIRLPTVIQDHSMALRRKQSIYGLMTGFEPAGEQRPVEIQFSVHQQPLKLVDTAVSEEVNARKAANSSAITKNPSIALC
ncbi:hypothetical protein BDW75DRAFT_3835 [Aspergillus navahoensis]